MDQPIDAIFDDGVLKPLVPLSLPDKARVRLTLDAPTEPSASPASQTTTADAPQRLASARADVQPRDEWEIGLLRLARNCEVSIPNAAVSSEGLYE